MTFTHTEPLAYPFNESDGLGLSDVYEATRKAEGLVKARMPHGEPVNVQNFPHQSSSSSHVRRELENSARSD